MISDLGLGEPHNFRPKYRGSGGTLPWLFTPNDKYDIGTPSRQARLGSPSSQVVAVVDKLT